MFNDDNSNLDGSYEQPVDNKTLPPPPDEHQLSQIQIAYKSFNSQNQIPDLVEQAGDNKTLQCIARGLTTLFSQPGIVRYSAEDRRELDYAIRTFVYQLCQQSVEKGKKLVEKTLNDDGIDANMVLQLKERLAETEKLYHDSEKRANEATEQKDEALAQIENYKIRESQFVKQIYEKERKMNASRSEYDTSIAQIRAEMDQYDERCKDLQEKLKLNDISSKRLEDQLEKANEEIATLSSELTLTKNKLVSKKEKLGYSKEKCDKLMIENRRLDFDNQQMASDLNDVKRRLRETETTLEMTNQDQLNKLDEENQKLRDSISHLSEICSTQSEDLAAIQTLQANSTVLLRQQLELIAQYDAELSIISQEKEDLQVQSEGDAKLISALQEQLNKVNEETSTTNVEVTSHDLEEIKELLRPRYGEGNPVQTVRELLEGATNDELKSQNVRQAGLIENLLRFIARMVNTGELKQLLSHDSPEQKLADDESFKDQLLIEIARCRQFANQSNVTDVEMPSQEEAQKVINTLSDSDRPEDRELFNILASQTLATDTLRKLYEKSNLAYNSAINELKKVDKIVNYEDGPADKLPSFIVEKLLSFKAFSLKLANVVDDDYDPEDFDSVLKYLFEFVQFSAKLIQAIEQNINYHGELKYLPSEAAEYITNLQQQAEEYTARNVEITSMTEEENTNSPRESPRESARESGRESARESARESPRETRENEYNGHFQQELFRSRIKLNDLENTVLAKEKEIESLKQENENLKAEKVELQKNANECLQHSTEVEGQYAKLLDNFNDSEENLEKIRKENENLHNMIKKKSDDYDQRLTKLIEKEREQHQLDIQRGENRMRKREDKFKAELEAKSEKISQLKKKMREIIDSYEKAFKKQKETTQAIRQQNEILSAKLEKNTGPSINPREVERLKAEVKSLDAEKTLLNTKLKQMADKIEEVQAIRDNYWMAQMSLQDAENKNAGNRHEANDESIEGNYGNNNDHYDAFLEQLVTILEPYMPTQYEISEESVFNAISSLIDRLEVAENDEVPYNNLNENEASRQVSSILNTSTPNMNNVTNRETEAAYAKTLAALQDWDRWGRDLYMNVTDGEVPCQSCKELRYVLGEMILASIGHRKLVYRLDSLRSQKRLLLKMCNLPQPVETYPTFRMLLIVAIGSLRILRKTGHFPANYVQQVQTPTAKPTTVSLF